jgi:hypothetical protein
MPSLRAAAAGAVDGHVQVERRDLGLERISGSASATKSDALRPRACDSLKMVVMVG